MTLPVVFLRDDDVYEADEVFLELADFFFEQKIPIVYGVIPARLEDRMVKFLCQAKKRYPGLLDIAQHGFQHVNYGKKGSPKYEFGGKRSYRQQYQDVAKGRKIMRRCFGSFFTPAFIPPYHGFDETTLRVVQETGLPLFSAGKSVLFPEKTFLDLPAGVSLNQYKPDGTPMALDVRRMLVKARRAFLEGGIIGMVYHHSAIRSSSDMRTMKTFFRFLIRLRDEKFLRMALFSEFIKLKNKNV